MKKQKKAESLIAIIIAILILGFTLTGIINILTFEKTISNNFETEIKNYILELNSNSILKKVDLSNIEKDEVFYIYKNKLTKTYEALTGSENESYKYVNYLGENINPDDNLGKTYIRSYIKKFDILKHKVEPEDISNLVFKFDAQNPGISLIDGDYIANLYDLSVNSFNAYQSTSGNQPVYKTNKINGKAGIVFDGLDDMFIINDNLNINLDSYNMKSFAMVIKTGYDVTSSQIIYEQGGIDNGYNLMIANGIIYLGTYSLSWDFGHQYKFLSLGEAIPDSVYYITLVQDSSNTIDSENKLYVYLNGILINSLDHVDIQISHTTLGIGGINNNSIQAYSPNSIITLNYFSGTIGELISWNHALTQTEVQGIQNYFDEKWGGGNKSIDYNIIESNIKKYNPN